MDGSTLSYIARDWRRAYHRAIAIAIAIPICTVKQIGDIQVLYRKCNTRTRIVTHRLARPPCGQNEAAPVASASVVTSHGMIDCGSSSRGRNMLSAFEGACRDTFAAKQPHL